MNLAISYILYSAFVLNNMSHMQHMQRLSLSPELAVNCHWPQSMDRGSPLMLLSFRICGGWWKCGESMFLVTPSIFIAYLLDIKSG